MLFDLANSSVGLNTTPLSNRVLTISSSAGVPIKLNSDQATANRLQFVNANSVGNGVIWGSKNGDDFEIQQTDTTLQLNTYISKSGEVYLPRLGETTTSPTDFVVYDQTEGELTFADPTLIPNLYTTDGILTDAARTITLSDGNGNSGQLIITASNGANPATTIHGYEIFLPGLGQSATANQVVGWVSSQNGQIGTYDVQPAVKNLSTNASTANYTLVPNNAIEAEYTISFTGTGSGTKNITIAATSNELIPGQCQAMTINFTNNPGGSVNLLVTLGYTDVITFGTDTGTSGTFKLTIQQLQPNGPGTWGVLPLESLRALI